jgi:peptide chain release factor subunit 1
MATAVTTDTLRSLASFRARNGCAITLTVDLDPSTTPTIPDVKTKVSSVIAQAEKLADAIDAGRDCRLALRADVERLREWLDNDLDRDGARAIAVFASSADGLFRVLPLAENVPDSAHIGASLHIAPLVSALEREGDLVLVVSRERGTVYRFEGGRLREVADESEEQPGQHEQGGWSQARYQRHIDNLILRHLKTVGAEVDKRIHDRGLRIVVVSPEEMRGDFESALSKEAREAIIGWATAEAHASPSELLEIVRPLLDEARAREDQESLERFEEAHGRGERAATGWKQVLEAASDARVETLLVEQGADTRAWECPQCGRASADGGSCPLDGAKLEERDDAVDLAMHQTLAHGGSIVRVGSGALGESKGIAAVLRF